MVAAALKMTPLERAATPDDIARGTVYLADEATLSTGQVLIIDGGRTM